MRLYNPHRSVSEVQGAGTGAGADSSEGEAMLIKSYHGSHGYPILDIAIAKDTSKFASVGGDKTGSYYRIKYMHTYSSRHLLCMQALYGTWQLRM